MRELLARHEASGVSQAEFARSIGMPTGTFHWWKREISRRDRHRADGADGVSPPTFLPVRVARGPAMATSGALALHVGDVRIDVTADFDAEHLRRVLGVVRAC